MSVSNITFKKLFTYNLLLYSLNHLKKTIKSLDTNEKFTIPAVSKSWLKKTSYLISTGKFDYNSYIVPVIGHIDSIKGRKGLISKFKFRIIENAFVLLLIFFFRNCFRNDIDLIKCLRFIINF